MMISHTMQKEILCTLGPASMTPRVIKRLTDLDVSLFRINLSHTQPADLASQIQLIKENTDVPICLDSEGAQVRTGRMADGAMQLKENAHVKVTDDVIAGRQDRFSLYPAGVVQTLREGDIISVDFNAVLGQVVGFDGTDAILRVLNGGKVGSNKAVTVQRDIPLPVLTDKDRTCIEIGLKQGIDNFALSFANRASDVAEMRALVGPSAKIISKIECLNALANLNAIAEASDALLIDRGDLSRQVAIQMVPETQKQILKRGHELGAKVYVATNLLESMVDDPAPTRAEVNDIYNTLLDGADGLVLAAETAIGSYPIECTRMVSNMIERFENHTQITPTLETLDLKASSLIPPHGGRLMTRMATADDLTILDDHISLNVPVSDLMDCEQFATGAYSPLSGFMNSQELESVLAQHALPDATIWTLPIVLAITNEQARHLATGMRVVLRGPSGTAHSFLDIEEIYRPNLESVAERWFGTASTEHPGVKRLFDSGNVFIAGPVTLIERTESLFRAFELTPEESRFIFNHKGWSRVVGFHGRNPAHRAHEFIQLTAVERTDADGLYISPVIGPKKPHDFLTGPILNSYQLLIENGHYPKGGVVLGAFATYSRYSGPREAVFTALCRKNMGCSHFIIGRDHTGVGNFYAPDANIKLFDQLGDIGITPVYFDSVGFDERQQKLVEGSQNAISISGTQVRNRLQQGEYVPEWFMRKEVQDYLLGEIAAGRPVFHD